MKYWRKGALTVQQLACTGWFTKPHHTSCLPILPTWVILLAHRYGFMVQVLVLPIHMEFTRSGEFTIWDRILQSIRSNLIYYAILLAVALAGLLLLLLTGHLKASNVVGFCIAFSNAYGELSLGIASIAA